MVKDWRGCLTGRLAWGAIMFYSRDRVCRVSDNTREATHPRWETASVFPRRRWQYFFDADRTVQDGLFDAMAGDGRAWVHTGWISSWAWRNEARYTSARHVWPPDELGWVGFWIVLRFARPNAPVVRHGP